MKVRSGGVCLERDRKRSTSLFGRTKKSGEGKGRDVDDGRGLRQRVHFRAQENRMQGLTGGREGAESRRRPTKMYPTEKDSPTKGRGSWGAGREESAFGKATDCDNRLQDSLHAGKSCQSAFMEKAGEERPGSMKREKNSQSPQDEIGRSPSQCPKKGSSNAKVVIYIFGGEGEAIWKEYGGGIPY